MNSKDASGNLFEEPCRVPPDQSARSLFARLPAGALYSQPTSECKPIRCLCTSGDPIRIGEMQQHVHAATEVAVGRTVQIEHLASLRPGQAARAAQRTEWVGACTSRLDELRPTESWLSLDAVAADLWDNVGSFDPVIAAEIEHESWVGQGIEIRDSRLFLAGAGTWGPARSVFSEMPADPDLSPTQRTWS